MALEIKDSNFEELLASGKPVVVDFWATWCGPCKKIAPDVEALAEEYKDQVIIGKCDVDDNDELTGKFGVRNIPTVLFIKDGEVKDKTVGAVTKATAGRKNKSFTVIKRIFTPLIYTTMGMEDDFLLEDEDDQKTIEFIKNYLPQDLKDKFTEDDLYYILDVIVDYYTSSGCLDVQPDEEGYINIDQDEIVNYIVKEAKKDGMGPYDPDDVFFVVQGEMEYGNSLGQVD